MFSWVPKCTLLLLWNGESNVLLCRISYDRAFEIYGKSSILSLKNLYLLMMQFYLNDKIVCLFATIYENVVPPHPSDMEVDATGRIRYYSDYLFNKISCFNVFERFELPILILF